MLRGVSRSCKRHPTKHDRGKIGLGDERRRQLLEDEGAVGEGAPETTNGFGERNPHPSELAHLSPRGAVIAGVVVAELSKARDGRLVLCEIAYRLGKHLLLLVELKVHLGIFLGTCRRQLLGS